MLIRLVRNVMIAPVGYYEERLISSIVSTHPKKLYLIRSKDAYTAVTDVITDSIKKRLPKYIQIDDKIRVDFTKIQDIYDTFVSLIKKEKSVPDTTIFLDVTSAPRICNFAATHLGQLFDITITYVGSQRNQEPIGNVNKFLKEKESSITDPGLEPRHYKTHYRELDADETKLLFTLRKKDYDSINSLISDVDKSALNSKGMISSKRQRYWSRVINRLETYQILELTESEGKKKKVCLTDIGEGLSEGLYKSQKIPEY